MRSAFDAGQGRGTLMSGPSGPRTDEAALQRDPAHPRVRHPWTFLTNHGHVLLAVAADPDILIHDIADTVGITPRATLHILKDLEEAGYLQRIREGRRTHYVVVAHRPFRHPATAHQDIGALLAIFTPRDRRRAKGNAMRCRPEIVGMDRHLSCRSALECVPSREGTLIPHRERISPVPTAGGASSSLSAR